MNTIQQFRAYVNKYGYFKNGRHMIEWEGKEYPVASLWNLINLMGIFNNLYDVDNARLCFGCVV